MNINSDFQLRECQSKLKSLAHKRADNLLKTDVKPVFKDESPKLKKTLDMLCRKHASVQLEKLPNIYMTHTLSADDVNDSIETSMPAFGMNYKENKSKAAQLRYTNSLTKENKKNLANRPRGNEATKDVESTIDLNASNIDSKITSLDNCKEVPNITYTNLPTRVGSFEIRIDEHQMNQLAHGNYKHSSGTSAVNSESTNTDDIRCSEKTPRPLSPEILIKDFDKSILSSVNRRKQRTPVKADLKKIVESPSVDIESPSCKLNSSKIVSQNSKESNLSNLDKLGHIRQSTTGKKVKKRNMELSLNTSENSEVTSTADNILNSSISNLPKDSTNLNGIITETKTQKRKLHQTSKNLGSEPQLKKQKKKIVKFHPNISEVFKSPADDDNSTFNKSSPSQVSDKEILDESLIKLLQSRNLEVTFHKPKSADPQKLSVLNKNSRYSSKSGNKKKNLLDINEKTGSECIPDLIEENGSNEKDVIQTNSFPNLLEQLSDSKIEDNAILNSMHDDGTGDVSSKNKVKHPTARMKTTKVPIKSILKKKSFSPKPKDSKVLSNVQIAIEKCVNAYDEPLTPFSVNKKNSLWKKKSSNDESDTLLCNVSIDKSQLDEEGSSPTKRKNKESPSIIQRGRAKRKKIPKSPSRKYSKKLPKRDLIVGADTSENREGSASDTDDNMPVICFKNAKDADLEKKSQENKMVDDTNPLDGFIELLKTDSKVKKRRGRGRKRHKIGRPKSVKVKEEVDADSSFVEDDDEEEQVIAATMQSHAKRKHQKRTGRRYSVTGNWYIATGYLNDILSLLEDFENCDGWRFKDFAKCWQKKSFSLVYRGRQTFKELLEFSEEIALLTMRFIGPSHSTKRRIGALYTLYGLYYKFPVGHFFNLRLELGEYKNLLELVHPFRSNVDNPDPAYIFRKLEIKGAILHCATACEPCYDFHNEERDLVDLEYGKQKLAKSSAVNIAVPKIQLEADSELLSYYHSVKSKLTGKGREPEPERALSLISSEFLTTISSDLSEMRKRTLCELGMTLKTPINISTDDNSNPDESDEKRIHGSGDGISRHSELDCYLHSVEDNVLSTVNKGARAIKSLENNENIMLLQDKSVQDFMKPPTMKDLNKPLELANKKKGRPSNDIELSLNLNIKLPPATIATNQIQKTERVNLESTDFHAEIDEELLPHPCPRKRNRGSSRSVVLMQAAKQRFRTSKKTLYNPCPSKSLDETTEVATSTTSSNGISSTSLPFSDIPVISTKKDKDHEAVDINVTLTSGEEMKNIKVKVKLNSKELQEICLDPVRLQKFKAGLEPLVKLSLIGGDRNKLWLIQDIEPCTKEKTKGRKKAIVKPLCFKQRFECLKQDSPIHSSDSDFSSDESVLDVTPKRISKSKIDVDYIPLSDDEVYQKETDKLLDEEFEKEDPYESDISSPDEYDYPRRRGRRAGYYTEIERGPFDSDKLIKPKGTIGSCKLVPIVIGGKTRYFPLGSTDLSNTETEESNEKIIEELNTWNNFTSSTGPPLNKRRISRAGVEMGSNFSNLYPHDSRISYILSTTSPPPYSESSFVHRRIKSRPICYPIEREKSFKEFFKKITRHIKTESENTDNTFNNQDSMQDDSFSAHEEEDCNASSENNNAHEVEISDLNSKIPSTKMSSKTSHSNSHIQKTMPYDHSQEVDLNVQLLEPESDINEAVPKIEVAHPISQTIKKEFSHTIEELVDDWDDDEQIISSTKGKEEQNLKLGQFTFQTNTTLKREPLEDYSENIFSVPEPTMDVDLHLDSEGVQRFINNSIVNRLDTVDSATEIGSHCEISRVLRPPEFQDLLPLPAATGIGFESDTNEILDERLCEESFVVEGPNELPCDEQFISADGIKNLLYCKVKSSDGKDVFVPVTILPEIKSEIEVLPVHSTELALPTSPLKSPVNVPIQSETSCNETTYIDNFSSVATLETTPYLGSSRVNVKCSSHFPVNSIPEGSVIANNFNLYPADFNSPLIPDWRHQKSIDYEQQTNIHSSPFPKLPLSKTFQKQSTCSSVDSTESPNSSTVQSPISSTSSVSSISKIFESPSSLNSISKCSFFFSPKLKRLTNKKVASGRPPCSEQCSKPLVKFMFKGSSWMKSCKKC